MIFVFISRLKTPWRQASDLVCSLLHPSTWHSAWHLRRPLRTTQSNTSIFLPLTSLSLLHWLLFFKAPTIICVYVHVCGSVLCTHTHTNVCICMCLPVFVYNFFICYYMFSPLECDLQKSRDVVFLFTAVSPPHAWHIIGTQWIFVGNINTWMASAQEMHTRTFFFKTQ